MADSRVLTLLQQFFNIQKGQALPQLASLLGQESTAFSIYEGYGSQFEEDRVVRYFDYDSMDSSAGDISVALDTYAEESTQEATEEKRAVWVTSKDDDTVDSLHKMFDDIKIESKLFGMARHISKYGDLFGYPIIDKDRNIADIIFVHPSTVTVATDPVTGKITGFNCSALEIIETGGSPADKNRIDQKMEGGFSPWEMIHWKIPGSDLSTRYGVSMIEAARKAWFVLQMLETAVAIYRINRSGAKLVYYVDVGTASPQESFNLIQKFKQMLKRSTYLQIDTNNIKNLGILEQYIERNQPYSMNDDLVYPIAKESQSKVDVLQVSPDIAALEDIVHFQNKLRTSLGIPKAYFDQEISGWGANKALAQQDVRFAKKIFRIQKGLIGGLELLCGLHLLYTGKKEFSFTVHMETPSALFELQRLEVIDNKIASASNAMTLADACGLDRDKWSIHVLKEIMGLSSDKIKELLPEKTEERFPTPSLPPEFVDGDIEGGYGGNGRELPADIANLGGDNMFSRSDIGSRMRMDDRLPRANAKIVESKISRPYPKGFRGSRPKREQGDSEIE